MLVPECEEELAAVLSEAKAGAPLSVRGGGTRGPVASGEPLSVSRLKGVTHYEPGALTVVVRAGTPLAELEALLAAEGQRLAFEPPYLGALLGAEGDSTVGGVVAANASGPRRVLVGAARDFALGVRFVDGAGNRISNGGRVMKNVTGYDLVKLMAGSFGALGVISEVALKVLPAAETEATLRVEVRDASAAVDVMSAGLGSPWEVSGAAYDPADGAAYLRIDGDEDRVARRIACLESRLAEAEPSGVGAQEISRLQEDASRTLWRGIRDASRFATAPGDVWRVSCRPSAVAELCARAEADGLSLDWGGGLAWMLVPEGTDLRSRLGRYDGHATRTRFAGVLGEAGRGGIPVFEPGPSAEAALERGLKERFDPKGALNPGIFAGGDGDEDGQGDGHGDGSSRDAAARGFAAPDAAPAIGLA